MVTYYKLNTAHRDLLLRIHKAGGALALLPHDTHAARELRHLGLVEIDQHELGLTAAGAGVAYNLVGEAAS